MITRSKKNTKIRKKIEKEKINSLSKKLLKILLIFITCITGVYLYSRYIGTQGLVVKEYSIKMKQLPLSFDGFKIIHFTDLHYGTTVYKKELKKLSITINENKPDIIVFTGDLIDKYYDPTPNDIKILQNFFNNLDPTISTYLISGNHDYYHENYEDIVSKLNVIFLNNETVNIYYKGETPIQLTGLSSFLQKKIDIEKSYQNKDDTLVNITLLHCPDTIDEILETKKIDLALAGHSHNGQVRLPFIGSIIKTKQAKKYYEEYYKINKTPLFISGGIGTSTMKIRLFNHPSINLYRLTKK